MRRSPRRLHPSRTFLDGCSFKDVNSRVLVSIGYESATWTVVFPILELLLNDFTAIRAKLRCIARVNLFHDSTGALSLVGGECDKLTPAAIYDALC